MDTPENTTPRATFTDETWTLRTSPRAVTLVDDLIRADRTEMQAQRTYRETLDAVSRTNRRPRDPERPIVTHTPKSPDEDPAAQSTAVTSHRPLPDDTAPNPLDPATLGAIGEDITTRPTSRKTP